MEKLNVEKIEEVKKVVTPPLTDGQLDKMAEGMKKELAKMEKVKVRIPVDKHNKADLVVPVCINGYIFQIERGKSVEVPSEVARILEDSGYLG